MRMTCSRILFWALCSILWAIGCGFSGFCSRVWGRIPGLSGYGCYFSVFPRPIIGSLRSPRVFSITSAILLYFITGLSDDLSPLLSIQFYAFSEARVRIYHGPDFSSLAIDSIPSFFRFGFIVVLFFRSSARFNLVILLLWYLVLVKFLPFLVNFWDFIQYLLHGSLFQLIACWCTCCRSGRPSDSTPNAGNWSR